MSKAILQQIVDAVETKGPELVKQASAVFQLVVGDLKLWVDLKNGKGATKWGEDKADVTITLADADFAAMAAGKLNLGSRQVAWETEVGIFSQMSIGIFGTFGLDFRF